MKRNLRAAGLVLLAALALNALAASAAQGEGPAHFTQPESKYPVAITGVPEGGVANNFFQLGGAGGVKFHCESVTYEATLEAETTTLTVTPHFTGCEKTGPVQIGAVIDMNGCDFVFTLGEKTESGAKGSMEIVCPPTQWIELETGLCDYDVPPQKLGGITYSNANGDLTVEMRLKEITYTVTKTNIFGPCTDKHETKDGSFTSDIVLSGWDDIGTHHWITKDSDGGETTKATATEGEPLDIDVG